MNNTIIDCKSRCLVGVISDTHGLVRPEAVAGLKGVSLIIHAGDVGTPEVLKQLENIAPVVAVRGNTDRGPWADELAVTEVVEIGTASIYVLHNVVDLDIDPVSSGFDVIICGHSHEPLIDRRGDVLYINPGSAGAQRLKASPSIALITIEEKAIGARIIGLGV